MSRGEFRVGTSGYQYDHWKGRFYPEDLPKKKWFSHYAEHFDTVEINNTFYNLPQASTFDSWRVQAPDRFRYALKFSRYGTHMKKLKDPEATIGAFLERAERLRSFLGPILVQLPPHWHRDPARLDAFLEAAPRRHRWAVEFRESEWLVDEIFEILRAHHAALCIHDLVDNHPWEATAEFVYLRFHGAGADGPYSDEYSPQALAAAATRIRAFLGEGMDVYAYFNNDANAYAVGNARDLRRYVEQRP